MSRREFLKRGIAGLVAAFALFVAACGGGEGGEEEENGEEENGEEENGEEENGEEDGGGY